MSGPEAANAGVPSAEVEALRQSYLKHCEKTRSEHQAKLEKELRGLEKLAQKYEAKAEAAAKQVGLDLDTIRTDFEQAVRVSDVEDRQRQFGEVRARHAPRLSEAINAMGVDRAAAQRELTDVIGVLPHAHRSGQTDTQAGATVARLVGVSEDGLIGTFAWNEPGDLPPPPPPPPQYTQTTLVAPYVMSSNSGGGQATPAIGRMTSDNSTWIGVFQQRAAVGSYFFAEPAVRRIRVETTINIPWHYTIVGAFLGYASAELLVNLKVLDGSSVVSSNRSSLNLSVAAVCWISSRTGGGRYSLSCEFDHAFGTPRNYAAMVELETWAGGGGLILFAPAEATTDGAFAERITAFLTR